MPATADSQTTFRRRQRVIVVPAMGPIREAATIVKPDKHWAGWWIVRTDDGAKLCVNGSMLEAAHQSALAVN